MRDKRIFVTGGASGLGKAIAIHFAKAGLISAPMMSNYNAVKAAVVSLSETMRVELGLSNTNTTVVCPAVFKTNLMESMNNEIPGVDMRGKVNRMMSRSAITAEDIADDIYKAVLSNEFWVVPHNAGSSRIRY
jgi:NAD(P)-dependent dehydrogenase (short-subunit alcohol dehydrogenase family)